jgi:hypothetical protein
MRPNILAVLGAILPVTAPAPAGEVHVIRKNQRTLQQIDTIYESMPPVRSTPPPGRWKHMPRTRRRLERGGTLTVVMLGDSIVNDTSRSCWNLLLERVSPAVKIEKVTCVRGSTGCWWYKEPGRVKSYVLDHDPDLVIIGGISQRGDLDSIRDVLRQIHAGADPPPDLLLMTGAFGRVDPRDETQWRRISDPAHHAPYRTGLEQLAREAGAAFLDTEAAWGAYVRAAGKDLAWFMRDPVHANERGEQILGRILAAYLTLTTQAAAPDG